MAFRYQLSPKAMVNVFEPKAVDLENTRLMRAAMMGAVCLENFAKLPKSENASIVWEVGSLYNLLSETCRFP